jgi:transmembrane sensor
MPENIKQLIVKYLTNDITQDELSVLNNWLKENENNQQLFNKFQTSWFISGKNTDEFSESQKYTNKLWQLFLTKIKQRPDEKKKILNIPSKYYRYAGLVASWLLIFFLGSLLSLRKKDTLKNPLVAEALPTVITAPLGAKCKVNLPDSSVVWLNAGSTIKYDRSFNIKDRTVELEGEAYFSVAKNPDCVFKVKTTDLIVRALGTKFNVKAYPEEKTVTATLEEGKIDVELRKRKQNTEQIVLKPNENITLYKADQKLELGRSQDVNEQQANSLQAKQNISKIQIMSNVNTALYTSWKDDRWIFLGEPLTALAPKLERRFNVKIVFEDDELRKYKLSGTIENETIEQIMQALRFTAPFKYHIEKNTIILSIDETLKRKYKKLITHSEKEYTP